MSALDFKTHIAMARTFDQERSLAAERSKRLAWTVAGASCALSSVLGLSLALMGQLKTVEPYVVQVEKGTGVVEVVSAIRGPQTYDEAVTRSFLRQYVQGREGYVQVEREVNFRTVMVMSAEAEGNRFAAIYRGSNPGSPQVVYGDQAMARVAVRSMTPLADKTFQVRFVRTVTRGQQVERQNWLATVTFQFIQSPMSDADRLINPLGFQVLEYRLDPEAS